MVPLIKRDATAPVILTLAVVLSLSAEVPQAQDDRGSDEDGVHAREPLPQHALSRVDCGQVAPRRGRRHAQAGRPHGSVR